jgi:hypothetical protein
MLGICFWFLTVAIFPAEVFVMYLPGKLNAMADDASRLWHLNDNKLLTHFNSTYPQHRSWQIYHPRPAMNSAVICTLHKKQSLPASFLLDMPRQPTTIGTTGAHFACRSTSIRTSKTSKIRSLSSKYTSTNTH